MRGCSSQLCLTVTMSHCPGQSLSSRRGRREPSLPSVLAPACPAPHCVCSIRKCFTLYTSQVCIVNPLQCNASFSVRLRVL